MNVLQPLELKDATTEGVQLVPTKKFFKPVIVLSAPIDKEIGAILKCDYLWNEAGTPRSFEGPHKLTGELADAKLTFRGKTKATGSLELLTEKVAHISVSVAEKTGMVLQFRAHLEENEDRLIELLRFLHKLNKESFTLELTASLGPLFGQVQTTGPAPAADPPAPKPQGPQKPSDSGEYSWAAADIRNHEGKLLTIRLAVIEVEGGFVSGQHLEWTGNNTASLKAGMTAADRVWSAESLALEGAAKAAVDWLEHTLITQTPKEGKERKAGLDWLTGMIEPPAKGRKAGAK